VLRVILAEIQLQNVDVSVSGVQCYVENALAIISWHCVRVSCICLLTIFVRFRELRN